MNNLRKNQSGLVSITITLVIMIIVTLLVSSFALVVRREQRQSLDRQLSTQAFYAAESGLEDARSAINAGIIDSDGIKECEGTESFIEKTRNSPTSYNFNKNLRDNVEYSCVLINMIPNSYKVTANPTDGTFVVPISSKEDLSRLRISWQNTTPPNDPSPFESSGQKRWPSGASTPPSLKTAALRVTVLPGFSGSNLSRDRLQNGSHTMFLYPSSGGGGAEEVQYLNGNGGTNGGANQGVIASGRCNTTRDPLACAVDITNLNNDAPSGSTEDYYLVIRPLYHSADIEIEGFEGTNVVGLEGSQAEVDVTGRAEDVLRRVQARLPISQGSKLRNILGVLPDGALETTDEICKLFEVGTAEITDYCDDPPTVTPTGSTPPTGGGGGGGSDPGGNGNATIGSWPPAPPGNNVPQFTFSFTFRNESSNPPGVVAGCSWDFGDGQSVDLPPRQCEYGDAINHVYEDNRAEILASNGNSGCRIYTVTLTMRFTAASGLPPERDVSTAYVPRGTANDVPDGICYPKYRTYTP